eukprot:TRINITY_DN7634_c0_g1_i1.p1 TRINITY_DN7634_c0_g1~~TRINITY_DN7634_c0_g1_i1.p1  ORF type:complete len:215 (+),score=29.68 TRINITY_DN7634_c0_g1_i1:77-721(+)
MRPFRVIFGFARSFRDSCTKFNANNPFAGSLISLSGCYAAGDVVSQLIERSDVYNRFRERNKDEADGTSSEADDSAVEAPPSDEKEQYDVARTLRLTSFAAVVEAPVLHVWYRLFLDRYFHSAPVKLFLDQALCAPLTYALFFPWLGWLKGSTVEEIRAKLDRDFVSTYFTDCFFWVPVNYVNFRYVSPMMRVPFVGVASFVWSIYLAVIGDST